MTRVGQRRRPAVRLPRSFYDDHWGRDLPTPESIQEDTRAVWVWIDDPALPALLEEARHYANACGPDARAAERLLEAHRRQTQTWTPEDPAPEPEDPDAAAMVRLERELNRG